MPKPKQAKTIRAEVEIRYTNGDTVVKTEFAQKVLHWAGARRGWFFLDITGTRKTFLDSPVEGPHYAVRQMRSVENVTTNNNL